MYIYLKPVGKRRDHQPLLGTQVLELVVEVDVGDGNHTRSIVVNVVCRVRPPVEPCLGIGVGVEIRTRAAGRVGGVRGVTYNCFCYLSPF